MSNFAVYGVAWKPIDTAPEDENLVVLVFDRLEGVCSARRSGSRSGDVYYVPHPSSPESELLTDVTHWQPAPPAPLS